ncbi:hypothetical protein KYG_22311 [Acidovorax sp. NO-1]|uniref:hypothetical protein n=1 Tax=Acidovorax sp. NO-1 TaxID=512030 RepID=UPI00024011EC|nr:hypothetical protein [Acidovorax sp. NO-1]EHL20636.1 hypothetical protein KYG_22311 [Acidovorax sp. NO-1]
MNFKRRGSRISLYRSIWVPKGPGVTHGHTCQYYVGSICVDATALPSELAVKLSPDECAALERKVLGPAREAKTAELRRAQAREVDPNWRLDEALRLVGEAALRSQADGVMVSRVQALKAAVDKVNTVGDLPEAPSEQAPSDPLGEALNAIAAASQAVRQGRYGRAPDTGFRKTRVFKQWTAILAAIDGAESSLLRALQEAGYATRRKR